MPSARLTIQTKIRKESQRFVEPKAKESSIYSPIQIKRGLYFRNNHNRGRQINASFKNSHFMQENLDGFFKVHVLIFVSRPSQELNLVEFFLQQFPVQ